MRKTTGYVMQGAGIFTVAWTMYESYQQSMLVEESIGGVMAGGILYLMGHFMAIREIKEKELHIEQEQLKIAEKRLQLEVQHWQKVESHLENIANGIQTNLPNDE